MGNLESVAKETAFDLAKSEADRRAKNAVKDTASWIIDNGSSWSLTLGVAVAIAAVVFFIFLAYNGVRLVYNNFKVVAGQLAFGLLLAFIVFVVTMIAEWVFILWLWR